MFGKTIIFLLFTYVSANLEGPFLFWGPKDLESYRKPALANLEQDELVKIYSGRKAIVVFKNQDAVPLTKENFPRLRKALESRTMLTFGQDYLEVHPDYVSNDTQELNLEGPTSERDAKVTETFTRLEDIYGAGNVLAIFGNSPPVSGPYYAGFRVRRDMNSQTEEDVSDDNKESINDALQSYTLYNTSYATTINVLLYSTTWPVLKITEGKETIVLSKVLGITVDKQPNRGSKLVVKYQLGEGTDRLSVRFRFDRLTSGYWWSMGAVEVEDLRSPSSDDNLFRLIATKNIPQAPIGKSYHCSHPLVFESAKGSLTFTDIQFEPFMTTTEGFSDAFDCTGFTSVPIWSGIFVVTLMLVVLAISLCMLSDIKIMDKFDSTKGKTLTITVTE